MNNLRITYLFFITCLISIQLFGQNIAVLKYDGGGDWYSNPTALPNLIDFCNENINTKIDNSKEQVDVSDSDLFDYPIVFLTGHGNVYFDNKAVTNLRNYLSAGGFLHISDNYGLDKFIRREMKKVFPELDFIEIPATHPIYHQSYNFPNGIPKIHEHDNKAPKGYGLFLNGRLICFYDFEADLSDGWEDESIHNDPIETRTKALKMGANIIEYAFKN